MGKPMKFRAACIILLSMGVAATAQTASRYEQLVAKAENGDADTDYTALRHAYAESAGYDPYGVKWRAPFNAAWAAFQAKDCATALARSEEARKIDYTAVSVHAFRADCFRQAGDGAHADRELAIARGLARSEMAGGDGKTVATAYDIVTMGEERFLLSVLGVRETGQALLKTDGGPVDAIAAADSRTGETRTVYFKLNAIFLGQMRIPGTTPR